MPRKLKSNILAINAKQTLLKEIYNDTFLVKNTSLNIMKNISKDIDYGNKSEVLAILPLVQKQMDIINKANDTILEIESRVNG